MAEPGAESMRAVVLPRFGGPEVLRPQQVARPAPGPREVVVEVAACGVCRHDLLTRKGAFPDISLPVIPGHAIVGRVASVGAECSDLEAGARVVSLVFVGCGDCAQCRQGHQPLCEARPRFIGEDFDGGYAEYVAAPEWGWLRVPEGIGDAEATGLTCMLGTAYHAVVTRGGARAGERVLVTGASGGVGRHVVDVLSALGCSVLAVTQSPHKSDLLRQAGADEVVVAEDGSYAKAVKARTDGRGADLAIEIVGGAGLNETIHSVRPGGRIVLVGNVDGASTTIKPAVFILKEISLIGTKAVSSSELEEVMGMVASGRLSLHVAETVALEEAPRAHEAMESGAVTGRTVIVVEDGA